MTDFKFGDIVLVPFPFTDQSAAKKRPAVVISSEAYHQQRPDLIIMAVTSQVKSAQTVGDVCAGLARRWVVKAFRDQACHYNDRTRPGYQSTRATKRK